MVEGGGGVSLFRRKGRGVPFSDKEKTNIYILGNFKHFGAQKLPKCSKIVLGVLP
jgi:hypothetical protein